MSDGILEFKPRGEHPDARPLFERKADWEACRHNNQTFQVDMTRNTVTCSRCDHVVEAIEVIRILSNREDYRDRQKNSDLYHRLQAEEAAEKQAAKTRKAAYETLHRFGVTPEMYAEEYRRRSLLSDLEARQDYTKTLPFQSAGEGA